MSTNNNKLGAEFKKYAMGHRGISSLKLHTFESKIVKPITSLYKGPIGMTPNIVIENPHSQMAIMDVFSKLMMDRIIFLGMPIYDDVANVLQAQLLFLESQDKKKDITIYVNSPGGSVSAGLGIIDTMEYVTPDITTVVTGMAASMGFVIAVCGTKGKRYALKHARLMQHQPMGGNGESTQATDMEITVNEINKYKKELYTIIADKTGQTYEKIYADADRDCWFTSQEALEYGAIDKVVNRKEKEKK